MNTHSIIQNTVKYVIYIYKLNLLPALKTEGLLSLREKTFQRVKEQKAILMTKKFLTTKKYLSS